SSSREEASIRAHSRAEVVDAIDPQDPITRNYAARVASETDGPFSVEQVARIWSHVRGKWRYVNDPRGSEYFASAAETIENEFVGDCDDFAIVLASMVEAVGGEARIVMMGGPAGGHAYTEVCLPIEVEEARTRLTKHYRSIRDPNLGRQRVRAFNFRNDETCAVWLNLDWNAGVPGGPYEVEEWAVAIYPDGRTQTLAPAGGPLVE
ncbi:MAG: transglutaminase-like putative cysteine protease, partial [Polyangiales bacterium]